MLNRLFRVITLAPALALFVLSAPVQAARTQPLYNPDPIEVPAGKSAEQVKAAVRKAMVRYSFSIKEIGPGHVEGKHVKHSKSMEHTAVVTVKYDTKSVRITYKDSKDLNYDASKQMIHGTYNRWIRNLEKYTRAYLEE